MEPVKYTEVVAKDEKIVVSKKWRFNWQDAKAMLYGFAKYYSIPIIYLLEEVRRGATWEEIKRSIYTIVIMQAISFFTKLRDERKYVVEK